MKMCANSKKCKLKLYFNFAKGFDAFINIIYYPSKWAKKVSYK